MAVQLSRQRVIDRAALQAVAETRLHEAQVLLEAKCFGGAIYLAGYGVECYLKLAICITLEWDALRGMFKTHDLEGLMLYSGLNAKLEGNPKVRESFAKILELWTIEGEESTRYRRPTEFDERTARLFLDCINDPNTGVVMWLKRMASV